MKRYRIGQKITYADMNGRPREGTVVRTEQGIIVVEGAPPVGTYTEHYEYHVHPDNVLNGGK